MRRLTLLLFIMLMTAISHVTTVGAQEIGTSYSIEQPGFTTAGAIGTYYAFLPLILGDSSPALAGSSPEAQNILDQTNAARAAAGCPALTLNSKLSAAAQGHATDMVQNDFFAHVGSDGATVGTRMTRQGYIWNRAGENIAAGYTDADSVMVGWMNSPGHRANILNCAYRELGVGYVYEQNDGGSQRWQYYWVQVFGSTP